MGVVDDAEHRLVGTGGGHQAQHGQPDEKSVGGGSTRTSERDVQRVALWFGQPVEVIDQRRTQLLETGEGQLHVGFHTRDVDTAKSIGLLREVGEQRGFSDTCLAAEHQDSAAARSHGRYQPPKRLAFAVATAKTDPPTLARHRLHRTCFAVDLTGPIHPRVGPDGPPGQVAYALAAASVIQSSNRVANSVAPASGTRSRSSMWTPQ